MARSISLMTAVEEIDDGEAMTGDEEAIEVPGDVRDSEDDVKDSEEVVDGAGDDVDTLEEIKDVLDDAADNGEGIDDTAAKIVEITTEAIYARLGFTDTKVVGSLESFKNPRSRVTATRMAAETIGDRVDRVWEAIKKFFKDLREKVKALWTKYVTAVGRLKRAAEGMRRKVAATTGSKKEDTFEDKNLAAKILGSDKKLNIASALDNTIKKIEQSNSFKDKLIDLAEKIGSDATKDIGLTELAEASGSFRSKSRDNRSAVPANEVMIGNKAIEYYMDEAKEKVTLDVFESTYDNDVADDTEIEVADKRTLEDYCGGVIKVCNAVLASRERKEKGDKKAEKMLDRLSKKSKAGATVLEKVDAKNARVVREILRATNKLSYLPEKVAISGCHDVLAYVNKCLRVYSKEK